MLSEESFSDCPTGRGEEELVLHRDIYFAVLGLNLQAFVGKAGEGFGNGVAHGFQLTLLGFELGTGDGFLLLQLALLGKELFLFVGEFAALQIERLLLFLQLLLTCLQLAFLVGQLFGAGGEEVLCAGEVAALACHLLDVVLHGGVIVLRHLLDTAVQTVDAGVGGVLGEGQVGIVVVERLVLS